jgi:hypothetical protein
MSLNCGHYGPIVHPPYEYGEPWWNDIDKGTRPAELTSNSTTRHLVSKLEELAKEMINLVFGSNFLQTWKGCLTCCKILRHGADSFTSLRKKACCEFLLPLKIHRPQPGFNPRNLATIGSTLTITPPRTTIKSVLWI